MELPTPTPLVDRPSLRPLAAVLSLLGATWLAALALIIVQLG